MESLTETAVLKELGQSGVGFDPKYPDARWLTFVGGQPESRFWVVPAEAGRIPHFVESLIGVLDEWRTAIVWPRNGGWHSEGSVNSLSDKLQLIIQRGVGISDGLNGAVRLAEKECDLAVALFSSSSTYGWDTEDDLYLIPDHARQIVMTDHHNVIHIECEDRARMLEIVEDMASAGYELPLEPPDWTFKWPDWMAR